MLVVILPPSRNLLEQILVDLADELGVKQFTHREGATEFVLKSGIHFEIFLICFLKCKGDRTLVHELFKGLRDPCQLCERRNPLQEGLLHRGHVQEWVYTFNKVILLNTAKAACTCLLYTSDAADE